GAGQERVANEDETARAVQCLREVAAPFERGRHTALVEPARVGAREEILRPEEEELVPFRVEPSRQQHGPADRPGLVVELVQRLAQSLLASTELVAVQRLVALVVGRAAVKVLAAAPRDNRDRGAGAA